ncbi:MAG: glycosyltransferase family 4 protein [Pseudomonadota bacterium]
MQLLILFLTTLLIGYIATLCWFRFAQKRLWLDQPNHRSSHAMPTPTSGGIGFVIAFFLYTLILFWLQVINFNELLLLSAAIVLAITGFIDDLRDLSIQKRLFSQFAVCCFVVLTIQGNPVLVVFGDLQIEGIEVRIFILLGLLWLINLYNFMDGIDGLAVTEAIFFSLSIALLVLSQGNYAIAIIALGLALSLCGFLYFNLSPAIIFMGDLGSNYLGLLLGVIGTLGIVSGTVNVWTVLVLLSVFIVDSTTTLIARMRAGLVWYHGHNSHAYQYAARMFKSHGKVVAAVCFINIFWLLPLAWMTIRYQEAGLILTGLAWIPLAILSTFCKKGTSASPLN